MLNLLVVLLPVLANSQDFKDEGSSCTTNTIRGICKLITECPYAQDLLKEKLYPQICGFVGKTPIVCCAGGNKGQNSPLIIDFQNQTSDQGSKISSTIETVQGAPPRPLLAFQNIAVVSDRVPGELSRNKCLTYYPKPLRPIYVTGGRPSLAKEFPHMAIIGYGEKENIQWLCGGSLISRKFVLTAAHCLTSYEGDAKFVRLGDLDLSTDEDEAYPEDFTVARRIPHPSYRPPVRYHDIALIELDREVALSAFVSPACLHTERELNSTRFTATGWGNTGFRENASSFLLKVDLDYVPQSKCLESYGKISKTLLPNGIDDDFQICAGGVIGEDTCQGDSGGPLQIKNYERTFTVQVHNIVGVTSFGKACGLSSAPAIYTRVSSYLSWIEDIALLNERNLFALLKNR